jgi:hypothetical protein
MKPRAAMIVAIRPGNENEKRYRQEYEDYSFILSQFSIIWYNII